MEAGRSHRCKETRMTETGVPGANIPAAAPADYDAPGMLSIVVQGALFQGNLVETANHCRHWRQLFPSAEIILALSLTDVVFGEVRDGIFTSLRLVPAHRHDGHLQAALGIIRESCDKVALAGHALPLPPIKADTPKLNNANLQIAAAQRGLGLATGRYVLRMRADMVFMDRSFLDQYAAAGALPRGAAAMFDQRVLISWLYTLNPYTLERMPLHFSDWFHFGLLHDVRRIWQVPPMTLADSMHYRTHPHAPGSNARERLFNTRLGVEQHILLHCFKADFPGLVLDHHNDRTSVTLAMDLLVDNFTLCDLVAARCVFNKYSGEFTDHAKRYLCLTREDWLAMARARGVDYRTTLSHKIIEASDEAAAQAGQGFPRTYEASRLTARDGRLLGGEIVADAADGVLFFGPYVALPAGRYMAAVNTTTLEGHGTISLRVTLDAGDRLLAKRTLTIAAGPAPRLEIPFDVPAPRGVKMELVCGIKGLRGIAVSGITIRERLASEPLDAGGPKQGRPASRWFTRRKASRA
jgi:hypothetical protein